MTTHQRLIAEREEIFQLNIITDIRILIAEGQVLKDSAGEIVPVKPLFAQGHESLFFNTPIIFNQAQHLLKEKYHTNQH